MKDQFLKELYEHQGLVHKICRIYRNTLEDREDLFQEITYQLWKAYPKFRRQSRISTWIYRIALNTALATFRKSKIEFTSGDQVADSADPAVSAELTQEELLYQVISQLEEDEKSLIALYLEGMSYSEISAITGLTENHIGVRLNRIKKKIKTKINQ